MHHKLLIHHNVERSWYSRWPAHLTVVRISYLWPRLRDAQTSLNSPRFYLLQGGLRGPRPITLVSLTIASMAPQGESLTLFLFRNPSIHRQDVSCSRKNCLALEGVKYNGKSDPVRKELMTALLNQTSPYREHVEFVLSSLVEQYIVNRVQNTHFIVWKGIL